MFELLLSDEAKTDMEQQNFVNMVFHEATVIPERSPRRERVWHLWCEEFMPGMLNEVSDVKGKPAGDVCDGGCYINELFFPQIIRYKRSQIEQMGAFDVALTGEYFGNGPLKRMRQPIVICSPRFRKWCVAMKLKLNFYPISLEP